MFTIYHFDDIPQPVTPHEIVSFSYTNLTKAEPSLPHAHPYTEIMLVVEGSGVLVVEQKKLPFERGKLYFVNPYTEHLETSGRSLKYYVLKISNFTVYEKSAFTSVVELTLDYNTENNLRNRFSQIWSLCESKHELKKKVLALDLCALRYSFLALLDRRGHVNQGQSETASPKLQEVIRYISANYALDLKISDLAKKFAFSHNNLIYHFQKELHTTPSAFILMQRIHVAKGLLKNTDYTISQIANLCGFSQASFFGKTFKKLVGKTPSAYRAKNNIR